MHLLHICWQNKKAKYRNHWKYVEVIFIILWTINQRKKNRIRNDKIHVLRSFTIYNSFDSKEESIYLINTHSNLSCTFNWKNVHLNVLEVLNIEVNITFSTQIINEKNPCLKRQVILVRFSWCITKDKNILKHFDYWF